MNAVEIEQAITELAERPFDAENFPYEFLEAFGNKETTIKRLRAGASNKSDIGGVLQTNNIHIATCQRGHVPQTLQALRASPATSKSKAKFILATDGVDFEAEDLIGGATVACAYKDFPDHFGRFLPLAGITSVGPIDENTFDIRATSRLNRLYVELLKDNPDWGKAERRHDMNHFMARLIFCFFAEHTDIFVPKRIFINKIAQMSAQDSSNTHEVIGELFRAMNTRAEERERANIPRWADPFPYVNGGLFSGSVDVPRFSKIARAYLLHVGGLDWTKINPDIFGSMIQAVAEDEERGELGMHYTSVPNILKVLNPLFLDDLRTRLADAGDNPRSLLNLRKRISKIRVFDPACGSGNFLVIAYKEMRAIEAEINNRRGEPDRRSEIPLTNFKGIELRDFPAEIARLALIIAEYQCDVIHRGQKLALAEFLPLRNENWIICGNALRLEWASICDPSSASVKLVGDDLFNSPLDQAEIEFENVGGEIFVCGNPPYKGASEQSSEQKADLEAIFENHLAGWKSLDYVAGWYLKAAEYCARTDAVAAFVSTNSVCQGQQVPLLWPLVFGRGHQIRFAYTSFKWANLASHNAGVTVVIVCIGKIAPGLCKLYTTSRAGDLAVKEVSHINAYLIAARDLYVLPASTPVNGLPPMDYGSKPADGGGLVLSMSEKEKLNLPADLARLAPSYVGSTEFIDGKQRYCLWITRDDVGEALKIPAVAARLAAVKAFREQSKKKPTREAANWPHAFVEVRHAGTRADSAPILIPIHTSENRDYLPVGLLPAGSVVSNAAFALFDAPLWTIGLIASRMHLVWIAAVCGKIKTDFRYSNTLGWNTFPVPALTDKNKDDLTRCAADILLVREHHFPATIGELYESENMPADLRAAHERNDEVLERIYIGRRFKNDTERLEKLFDLYSKMTAARTATKPQRKNAGVSA
ncbi:class I SAM-dependent DNA methyltransferase [Ramlibacter sp.]|uniref:class I SAM-dependent DNA methyltransferase n=1 Tax=Ramlibacter sp. TaxID=1917967 RepID=UPI002BA541DF|nr:DNA methyltransferase [Ramlibacter sp.]HWI81520.1 DNA methyltransferase [Ramlibacter sp.]